MPQPRTPQDRARRAVIADAAVGDWREHERHAAAGPPESREPTPSDPLHQAGRRVYAATREGLIEEGHGEGSPAGDGAPR